MTLAELKTLVTELLVADLDQALKTAQQGLPETAPKAKQILLLLGKHADLQKGITRGILSAENIELGTNQVRSSLIDLMDSLTESDLTATSGTMAPVTATKPKFVVVYDQSASDQAAATLLLRHLNMLKFTGKIDIYDVHKDKGGENTLERAEAEWANADYMLALITVNLFNSEDWFGMVYKALGEGRRVIPIRIQRADYEGTGLEKLRSLPTQNRAVSDFGNTDDAYTDIVSEIKRLLPGAR